jgi:hypothetical protein
VSQIHPDLQLVLDAVEVLSPTRVSIQGEICELPDNSQDSSPVRLLALLEEELYRRLYIRPARARVDRADVGQVDREFLAALSRANTGQGTWEPGWTIRRVSEDGYFVASRSDLALRVAPSELRTRGECLQPGQSCSLRIPKEMCFMLKGYYVAVGDVPFHLDREERDQTQTDGDRARLRFYWHLTRDAAAPFVAAATACLNAVKIPFQLKVVRDSNRFTRADAAVLFLARRDALNLGTALRQIYESVAALRPEVPLFTRKLVSGLSVAEEPAGSLSFGQSRCRLIAQSLWASFSEGDGNRVARTARLADVFRNEGLDPDHPHLGPGWRLGDLAPIEQAFASGAIATTPGINTFAPVRAAASDPARFLNTAVQIGLRLCGTAHWDSFGQLCNWVGRSAREMNSGGLTPTVEALGPDLYSGSAGIACFLAELHSLTGDASCRRTALGAMARSIDRLRHRPAAVVSPLSFYCGHLGVACAARRIGDILGDADLGGMADRLIGPLADEVDKPHALDVMGGNAGAIPALLALSRRAETTRSCARELAIALGQQLCQKAARDGRSWTWVPDQATGPGTTAAPLCGMSHGASGMAVALLELHAGTKVPLFLEAARGAFAYEDSVFDHAAGDWPDHRFGAEQSGPGRAPHRPCGWCHGAAGIALARLCSIALDSDHAASHHAMARRALATTLAAAEENLGRPPHDASLCHGVAGLVDILLLGGSQLGDDRLTDRAAGLGQHLIDHHARSLDYPSGLQSGAVTPSLLLGLAGVGHAFLRLHAPDRVPTVLLPGAAFGG